MSRKKTAPRKGRWSFAALKNRRRTLIAVAGLIIALAAVTVAGPWGTAPGVTRVRSLFFSPPPPIPPPNNPSKEYIYAGGRLIATEEPNPMVAPSNLIADTFSGTRIDLTWTAAPNAHHYQVERASNFGGTFTVLNSNVSGTSFSDNTVGAVNAYLYRVRTSDAVGNLSPPGNLDVAAAVTFTDNPLTTGTTVVKAQHIIELRQAVNAIRATANLSGVTWTDSTLTSVVIKAVHVEEMRAGLNQALTAMGLTVTSYTDPSLASVAIKKVHIDELRQRVE